MATVQEALAGITFTPDFSDDCLVSDALVLVRMVDKESGDESFYIAESTNLSAITQLGMVTAAAKIINGEWVKASRDEG